MKAGEVYQVAGGRQIWLILEADPDWSEFCALLLHCDYRSVRGDPWVFWASCERWWERIA